jgi:RNA polymerase sigma factor (sigma-70 family)
MRQGKVYIIQKAREGDRKAMQILYEEYYQFVLDYVHRYLMNYSQSKDLTQDIFLRVFEKLHLYKGHGDFGAWLNTLCRNYIISYLRKEKKQRFTDIDPDAAYSGNDEELDENEFELFKSNLSIEDVYELLSALDTKSRTIFNLYAVDGLSHKEIALQLGMSEGTSKSQLSRARVKLKNLALQRMEVLKNDKIKKGIRTISLVIGFASVPGLISLIQRNMVL